jgi:hypothetical protein
METQEETEVQEESPPIVSQETISQEVVDRARGMGHRSKEEWRGDPEKWVPADKYVERGETLIPIMKSQMGKYENKITNLEAQVESQKKTTEKLLKMGETVQKRAYEQAKRDLTQQQVQAVSDGNVEEWQKLEDKKDSLPQPEVIEAEKPVESPVFDQWHTGNEWYLKDEDMTDFANLHGQKLQNQNPNMPYDQVLQTVEAKIKETFPAKFQNPNREIPSTVDGSVNRQVAEKTNGQSYNDLDANAKAMCNQNVEQGLYKSKEDWTKAYFEEE